MTDDTRDGTRDDGSAQRATGGDEVGGHSFRRSVVDEGGDEGDDVDGHRFSGGRVDEGPGTSDWRTRDR